MTLPKLQHDLERYQTIRRFVTDQQASTAIEDQIRETRDRLAQIELEMGEEAPRAPP